MADSLVSERLVEAMNAHDIEAFVACFAPDYRSEQPAHPDRSFGGRDQVRANWSTIFQEVPDLRAELIRSASSPGEEWSEWQIYGRRRDATPMDMRGVIIMGIREGRIAWARLFLELVEQGGAGIVAAVRRIAEEGDERTP